MKAVIYARYSSDNQREESIEGQLRECMAYCKKNDITVLRTYIDRAMSAKTDHRPDFQRMIKDSAKGLFDVIIVWKLDRFARNRYDSAHYKAQLRKYGVKVLSATENISDGPEGIILESMLEGMAEYYSAELSEKVIRGHTENALKCKYNGGTPTFGYIIDKDMQYQIDPRTAPAVLEMFTMYDKGATMKEIVAYMSERGVTTVRGKKIDLNFMARLLKNRKYIGEYSYRHIVTPDGIPAIVPQDLFDRVQQRLAVNRKAPARHKAEDDYLLTTKLFCGTCGAMMVGESGTSSSKGRKYHYYRCVNTKKHRACDAKHKTVRKLPLENAVVNAVMAKIMDDNFVEYVADAVMDIQSRESSVLPALRKQLEEAESGITNMLNAIQMGIINASTKQRLDELEERKKDIELQIIQEEMKHPAVSREDVIYFVCRFRSLDTSKLDARRRLIDSFVNAVTIDMLPLDETVKKQIHLKSRGSIIMPRKAKASAEEKVQIVEAYLRGEMGLKSAAAKLSVVISTMELWIALYRAEGSNAFVQAKRNRCYPPEVKEAATKEYLFGKDSILSICQKYCIRSTRSLQQWIKVYNAHGDFNSRKNSGGGSCMKQGRDTTREERIQIVKDCLASGKNYGEMALKYKVSYQQVRTWTLRFEEMGEAGLEDRRGKRKKDQKPRTELEKAQIEIEQLKHKLYLAEMERDLLKKLDEIERREAFRK